MAVFNRREIELRQRNFKANVPNDPKAKLMYYLNCMCHVIELDDNPDVNRLRQFDNYFRLTQSDTNLLVSLCLLLKPDTLLNKCIFQNDNLCGDSSNSFFDLEEVNNSLVIAGSVMIGGQQKKVSKIMAFKMSWLQDYWRDPIQTLLEKQKREETLRKQREESQKRARENELRRRREERQRRESEAEARRQREERQRREREAEARRRQEEQQRIHESPTCVIL